MRSGAFLALLLSCAACKFHPGSQPPADGHVDDAPQVIDAPPSTAARGQREVVSGAGRTTAGSITIDVQIGHGVPVKKSTAGSVTIEGSPAVKP